MGKLLRITAYVKRFVSNANIKVAQTKAAAENKISPTKTIGSLTFDEIEVCKKLWIKTEQAEVCTTKKFPNLKKQLGLFTDEEGILRLGGRLEMLI